MALSHANPARDAGPPAQGPSDWPSVGEADRITLAQEQRRAVFAPLTMDDLDAVHAVEKSAYAHPWSRKHFADSVQAGHPAMMLLGEALPDEVVFPQRPDGRVLLGYVVAMPGVEEMHLLNITVAPAHQRQGWARLLLDALVLWSRGQGAQWLWLEVRASNAAARRLYERYGFRQVGVRKGYYPAGQFQREDAIVMNLGLLHPAAEGGMP
jgi:[ribosomal protein S18]-alanine N-acetyltransferase